MPEFNVILPETFTVAGAVKFPAVSVKLATFKTVVLPETLTSWAPDLLMVMLLNDCVAAVPLIDFDALPLKLMVLPVLVKVAPLFVQFPATLCVNAPAVKLVPEPSITFPPMVNPATPVELAVPLRVKSPPIEVVPACSVLLPLPARFKLVYATP